MTNTAHERSNSLQCLIAPRSIAIIGASNDAGRIGGRPLARLISTGFTGPVYPVNPTRDTVQGVTALKSALDLPEGVDCAIVAVPAEEAVKAIRQCAQRKVGAIVLFSAGFAEAGERGMELQEELRAISRESGIRILGPNCMGLFNLETKAFLTFSGYVPAALDPRFNVGVVTQSGGYGSHVLRVCEQRGIGVSHWMTTGNESDVEAGELLGALVDSPRVNAIFTYLEGIRSRENFVAALRKARARKIPVIAVKAGSSDIGAAAAASHTASLAGADAVYDAVFREYGVHRADSTEEAMDVLYALSRGPLPSQEARTAVFTLSGGVGVQIADYMGHNGLDLPELSAAAQEEIKALAPQAGTRNPLDITAQFMNDSRLVTTSLDVVLGREAYNVVFSFLSTVGLLPDVINPIIDTYGEMMARYPGRLNIVTVIGTPDAVRRFEAAGCIVFEEPKRAVRALAALYGFARAFKLAPAQDEPAVGVPRHRLQRGQRFNEVEAKAIARSCGIRVPQDRVIQDAREAAEAAAAVGFPVALKVVSADILHKTEVGGVKLGLRSAEEVARALDEMATSVSRKAPEAKIEGYVVSPMIGPGVECVVGITRDPVFGPVVMFGIGGILIELMRDVAFRLAPVNRTQALAMIGETKGAALLKGYRGAPPADIDALADAVVGVSQFAAANADVLQTFEINPLRVMPRGEGVIALDAVIETIQGDSQ